MKDASLDRVHQMIVWIPMLDSDERGAADRASALFRDGGVPQFWDGKQFLGVEVARSLGVQSWVAWDVYLFYGPDAVWTDAGLPPPDAALAQAGNDRGGGVVAMKGTLPPRGDQSVLPAMLRGRAVLAGDHADLPALLAQVAARFAPASKR